MYKFDQKEFTTKVKKIALSKYHSMTEFYTESGISSSLFSQWRTGETNLTISKIEFLAEFFGIPFNKLITGEEKENVFQNPEDQMSYTEHVLVNCWRRASEDDRDIITAVLKKYGFSYSSEKIEETIAVS